MNGGEPLCGDDLDADDGPRLQYVSGPRRLKMPNHGLLHPADVLNPKPQTLKHLSVQVWVNPSDVDRMAEVKQMSVPDFTEEYAEREVGGWVQLKNRRGNEGEELDHGCIFLGEDDKTCGIYDARPLRERPI